MSATIEVAKTGRAKCRVCRQPIDKGALRFGEEQPSAFGEGMQMAWQHLACAARKRPDPLREALAAYEGEVPEREEIEKILSGGGGGGAAAASAFPHAERAPTGRSKCLQCEAPIEKGTLRVAVEREVEVGGMARTSAGYLHPGCARAYTGDEDLLATLAKNSRTLSEEDRRELAQALVPPPSAGGD